MMTGKHTFCKAERLCLANETTRLFSAGNKGVSAYPVRAVYRLVPDEGARGPRVKVLMSVAKRRLRHAVDRNRAKRQLREAYRLQKELVTGQVPDGKALHIAFVWLAEKAQPSERVHRRIGILLRQIGDAVGGSPSPAAALQDDLTHDPGGKG